MTPDVPATTPGSCNPASQSIGPRWDVAIVGAGPAGSVAAAILAERGKRVLLIEKSSWPREKVCGGCLSAVAVQSLESAGLASVLRGAGPIERAVWHTGGQSVSMSTYGGAAILRSDLDAALVSQAVQRGCTFLPATAAKLLPADCCASHRVIQLTSANQIQRIQASVVLACDGIAGTSVDAESWAAWKIAKSARIGVSATHDDSRSPDGSESQHSESRRFAIPLGEIHMHIASGGYVGAVRLPSHQIHLAAALDTARCRAAGGPALLMEEILRSCGQSDLPDLQRLRLRGAGSLTRRRLHLGGHRVLVVGDACGYVEPFTGEGMGWAVQSALAVSSILPQGEDWPHDLPVRWAELHHHLIRRKQRWCAALRPLVHQPALAAGAIAAGRAIPAIGNFLAARIARSNIPTPHGDFA
jgi:menaquinone-9 beta-reductase